MSVPDSKNQEIARALKRCSAETIEAALRYQKTRDPADVTRVVHGILERDLPGKDGGELASAPGDTRLIEDLGMDSLTLMEVVMAAEEVFGITIENHELKGVATLDGLNDFIQSKVGGAS